MRTLPAFLSPPALDGRRRRALARLVGRPGPALWRALAALTLLAALPAWADGPDEAGPGAADTLQASDSAASALGPDPLAHWLQQQGLMPLPPADARSAAPTPAAAAAAAAGPADTTVPMRDASAELVIAALNFLEIPYRWGGNNADEGFDCSGFTRFVFATSLGLMLPRRAEEQARASALLPVRRDALRPGDLVFFNTMRRAFSHVGIYIGDGRFIHAPRAGAEVRIEHIGSRYWSQRFNGARRAGEAAGAGAAG
jgi:cell wall-associated NlpC family hydrolase